MLKKYRITGEAGIMPKDKLVISGEVIELDDGDPRLPSWLAEGSLVKVEEAKPAEHKKPGPKPKDKEGE